jgi:hypothetical protein
VNQIRGSCRNKEKGNKKKGGNDAKGIGIYEEDGAGEKAVPAGTNLRSGVQQDYPETEGCLYDHRRQLILRKNERFRKDDGDCVKKINKKCSVIVTKRKWF